MTTQITFLLVSETNHLKVDSVNNNDSPDHVAISSSQAL